MSEQQPKEFVSQIETLKKALELDLDPTPGFGAFHHYFSKASVAHPAKMNLSFLEYLILRFTEKGDTVLDPMSGTGSTGVVAALKGRNAILVELEDKFHVWQKEAKQKVDDHGTLDSRGSISLIKGDARNLSKLLEDHAISVVATSPPYSDSVRTQNSKPDLRRMADDLPKNPDNIGNIRAHGEIGVVVTSPPYHTRSDGQGINKTGIPDGKGGIEKDRVETLNYGEDPKNIERLKEHGSIDGIVTSPPYNTATEGGGINKRGVPNSRGVNKNWKETARYSNDPGKNIGEARTHGSVDSVVTSPPYAETAVTSFDNAEKTKLFTEMLKEKGYIEWEGKRYTESEWRAMNHGRIDGRTTSGLSKGETGYSASPENIGNLPVDKIITSPPYEGSEAFMDTDFLKKVSGDQDLKIMRGEAKGHLRGSYRTLKYKTDGHGSQGHAPSVKAEEEYMERAEQGRITHPDSIGKLKGGNIDEIPPPNDGIVDSVITSPPYDEGTGHGRGPAAEKLMREKGIHLKGIGSYSESKENIGEMKKETYLGAMHKCYQEMFAVLKPGGRAVIVVKPFTRNKKVVDLPWQTWLLLQKCGFQFEDTVKLRIRNLSFWRVLQYKRDPFIPQLRHEWAIVVRKP